jgi:hypothetical protein
MAIKIGQHIYGNLEKEASPRKVGGFQTIGYTRSLLKEAESAEIEKRLVYNYSEIEPVKLLFFKLPDEKYVISRIVPLPDLDRFGRKGLYLAHSFVFTLSDFRKLNYNPFFAFRSLNQHFISSSIEALNSIGPGGTDDLNGLVLNIPEGALSDYNSETLNEIEKWDPEELKKLAFMALNCYKNKIEKKSIALVGKSGDIEKTLNIALSLITNQNKLGCSFDTYFYACNPVANYFWALGYPSVPSSSQGFIIVDTALKNTKMSSYSSDSCYEKWLFSKIEQKNFSRIFNDKELAEEFHKLLSDEQYDILLLRSASVSFIQAFFEMNWTAVIRTINSVLKKTLGANLALRLENQALSYCQNLDPIQLMAVLTDGFTSQLLAEYLYEVFKNTRPSEAELTELGNFLKGNQHDLLTIRYLYWRQNLIELQKKLNELDEGAFREMIEQFIKDKYLPPSSLLFSPRSGLIVDIFIERANNDPGQMKQLPQMLKTLIFLQRDSQLKELIPFLGYLNLQQLREIEKEAEKSSQSISKVFSQSLQKTIASKEIEEKSKKSASGIFNKMFKRQK